MALKRQEKNQLKASQATGVDGKGQRAEGRGRRAK